MQFATEYHKLCEWYIRVATGVQETVGDAEATIFKICTCLATDDPENAAGKVEDALYDMTLRNERGDLVFDDCELHANSHGADIYELLANSIEVALHQGGNDSMLPPLKALSSELKSVSMHFLYAWTAFNVGKLDECVNACDLVAEPFCPIYTLMGQAFLDMGSVADAIDALKIACSISGNDELPHFQLAKAYYAQNELEQSWQKLQDALALRPNDYEIIGFLAIIAAETNPPQQAMSTFLLDRATSAIEDTRFQGTPRLALLANAASLGRRELFQTITSKTEWDSIPVNKLAMQFLAKTLRHLFDNNLQEDAARLLERAENWTGSAPQLS